MKSILTNNKTVVVAALLVMNLAGCATSASMITGNSRKIAVDTSVSGQPIESKCALKNDKNTWVVFTPGSVDVERSDGNLLISCVSDNGAFAGKSVVKSSANVGAYGNIAIGGLIGLAVDHGTGAGFNYPSKVTVELTFAQASQAPGLMPAPSFTK